MTEQIICFLLPSIADQSARFPFSHLLETLLTVLTKADESRGTNSKITPTPWLLYGVLAFVNTHLGLFTVGAPFERRGKIFGYIPEGRRARGRPKTTWRRTVERERGKAG